MIAAPDGMYLIQILLPLDRDETDRGRERLRTTRAELTDRFGGVTAYLQSPALGEWTDTGGARERDRVVLVEIVAADFDRPWWRSYARTLSQRFEQDAIHIRVLPMELVDPDAA